MSHASYSAGIDVSKHTLDIALFARNAPLIQPWRVENRAEGHAALIHALRSHLIDRVVLEATGRYHRAIVHALREAGLLVIVVNPKVIRRFAGAIGILAKTDRIDAVVLARYAQCIQPEPPTPTLTPGKTLEQEHRQNLLARHRQLTAMRAAELQRRGEITCAFIRASHDQLIDVLSGQIDDVAAELDRLIQQDPQSKPIARIMREVKGIGPGNVRTLLTHLPELGRVDRQRITALVGLAPYNDESGSHKGRRRIRGGRAIVRSMLYMAALTATRGEGVIAQYYKSLTAAGQPHKSALVACMRKLLIHLNSIVAKFLRTLPDTTPVT